MRNSLSYKPITQDQQTDRLAMCLPDGLAWASKADKSSNLYLTLKAIAKEINELEGRIYRLVQQWDIRITEDLIVEWETVVGIPDECRPIADTLAERRTNVINKLQKVPIVTVEDYKNLAETITGDDAANWNIRPGYDDYPAIPMYRNVLLVGRPSAYGGFDYPFGGGPSALTQSLIDDLAANNQYIAPEGVVFSGYPLAGQIRSSILECVFRKVTPAHIAIVYD